ncbi:MAG: lysophospholipid acyltransferase family protein [Acidiferrobacterales bacterium]
MAPPLTTERPPLSALLHPRHWHQWVGIALVRAVSMLPLPVMWAIGALLGQLAYYAAAGRRRVVAVNLGRCFPELGSAERRRLAKQHFRALGQTVLDTGLAWWASEARLRRSVKLKNRHYLDRAVADGKNVILLAPHFLGLEIAGIRVSLEQPLVAVFDQLHNAAMRRVMHAQRTRFQLQLLEMDRSIVSLVKKVRAGVPLYYLPDQDPGARNSAFIPFFDIPTATFTVLGRLARMTGAVVIPCYSRQLRWGQGYEVLFSAPLREFPTGDPVADATRMNREIESAIRKMPAQYLWVHKRFKTRPIGEPDFYNPVS